MVFDPSHFLRLQFYVALQLCAKPRIDHHIKGLLLRSSSGTRRTIVHPIKWTPAPIEQRHEAHHCSSH